MWLGATDAATGALDRTVDYQEDCPEVDFRDGGDVRPFRVGEEALDDVRQALQPAQPAGDDRLHLLRAFDGCGGPRRRA